MDANISLDLSWNRCWDCQGVGWKPWQEGNPGAGWQECSTCKGVGKRPDGDAWDIVKMLKEYYGLEPIKKPKPEEGK